MKILKYLFILITPLLFSLKVDALINVGINNGNKNYVLKSPGVNYGEASDIYGKLGLSFKVKEDSAASAFCIDPGLKSPTVEYKYKRELNLSTSLDQKFYKAYLYYVNNITSGDDKNLIRYYTDIVLRSILNDHGYAAYSTSAVRDNQYFGKNGIVDYIQGKIDFDDIDWSLGGNKQNVQQNCNYWVKTTNITTCKDNFKRAREYYKKFLNSTINWKNPLSISTSVEKTEADMGQEAYYTFKFKIKFSDGINNFFDYANYNNGYDMSAFFDYSLGYINDNYSLEGNAIEYSTNGHKTSGNEDIEIFVKISEETYNTIKENDPNNEVYIKLNFKYYHPMSYENVYVNSYVNTLTDTTNYQRMVIFGNYIHEDFKVAGKDIEEEVVDYYTCKQNGNMFFYDVSEVSISEYKDKCGCSNINSHQISNTTLLNTYNNLCITGLSDEFSSSLDECSSIENGKNTISHSYIRKINNDNNYCKLNCKETINIKNYVDKYKVLAGKYFELDKYPELESSKVCNLEVEYNNWNSDYKTMLYDEIAAVNKRLRDYAVNHPYSSQSISCSCGEECTEYGTAWYYLYKEYYYNETFRTIDYYDKSSSYITGNCGNTKPLTNSDKFNAGVIATKKSNLEEHFNNLLECNKYLYKLNNNYYNFKGDMSFYYEQTYYNLGTKKNDNKPYDENDDSEFIMKKKNDNGYNDGYIEIGGTNYNSFEFISDSYPYIYIASSSSTSATSENEYIGAAKYNDYTISRIRNFASSYEPSVSKYVDALTGIISSNKMELYNPTLIKGKIRDNVYDTHYTAIKKMDNINYYEFKSLGDNNEIYNYYIGNTHLSSGKPEKLKRYCEYEITNELFECTSRAECKLNIVYRNVEPSNIDPNNRLNSGDGFSNWKTTNAQVVKKKIENDAKTRDTYSPDNLEYSFTLDSRTIAAIRKENENYKYDDWNNTLYKCESGNKCESTFITNIINNKLEDTSGNNIKSIIKNFDGRNTWKEIISVGENKYTIDGKEVNLNS